MKLYLSKIIIFISLILILPVSTVFGKCKDTMTSCSGDGGIFGWGTCTTCNSDEYCEDGTPIVQSAYVIIYPSSCKKMQYQTNPIDLNRTCDDWKTIAKASSVRCGTCDPTKEIPIGVGNGCLFSCCIPLVEAPQAIQNVNNYNSATPPLGTKCGATSANWSTKNKCGTAGGCSDSKQMCKLNSSSQYACQYVNGYCGYSKLDEKVFYDALYSGPTITDIMKLITPIAQILYYGGLFIGMCFIVYSGYILMTSEGNPEMTQQGQQQLTAAILGILFILLSSAILRVIINSLIGGNISI